jgi:hypothetical protein
MYVGVVHVAALKESPVEDVDREVDADHNAHRPRCLEGCQSEHTTFTTVALFR